jgi:predicted nicotinamide N-methyase
MAVSSPAARLESARMDGELVTQSVELPSGELRVLQPAEAAELPDDGAVEWAPIAPYWAVLWRSGVALARELDGEPLRGLRVVELGCGLGAPSLASARAGASVLATDEATEALELVEQSARANRLRLETAAVDWTSPDALLERAPFDLVLAADVLYERPAVALLLSLLPRLAAAAWIADPGRPAAGAFMEQAQRHWHVETRERGVVRLHRLRFG